MAHQSSLAAISNYLSGIENTIAQLEQFLRDKEFFKLPRNELILALQYIQKVMLIIEPRFAEINQIDDTKRNLEANHSSSGGANGCFIGVFSLLVAIAGGVKTNALFGIIVFFATLFITTIVAGSTDDFHSREIVPLDNRKAEINREINNIMASDYVGWLLRNTLTPEYMNTHALGMFTKYLQAGRADNLKEAINLYEEERHRGRMESMQQANVFAAQAAAFHSFQTSMWSSEIAGDVRKIRQRFDR